MTTSIPLSARAGELNQGGDLESEEPAAGDDVDDAAIQEALDRAVAAEETEDWPAAINGYREAMELGLEEVDGKTINEVIAKLHYAYGTALYNEASYEDALRHFQDAQGLFPAPAFHYNIAKCQEELGKYEAAISSYQAFVRGVPDAPANIGARVTRLEETLALQAAQAEQQASEAAPPKSPGRALILSGATLAGIGVVTGTVGAIVFGLQAKDKSDQVDSIVNGGNPNSVSYSAALALDKDGRRAETLQFVMASVGGVITVTGAVILAIGLKKKSEAAPEATTAFRLTPTLRRDHAGLTLIGRF
jgi:tetratricopeptide (TPR) repeat protein